MAAEDYVDLDRIDEFELNYADQAYNGENASPIPNSVLGLPETEPFPMLKKDKTPKPRPSRRTIKVVNNEIVDARPKLIHCGNHLIDPMDVVCITKVQKHKGLYIVKLRSNPNPEYPIWVNEADITPLIQQFNVVTSE